MRTTSTNTTSDRADATGPSVGSQFNGVLGMRTPSDLATLEMPQLFAPEIAEPPASVRRAIRALFARLGIAAATEEEAQRDREPAPAVATSFENKVRKLRANAHAAYRSVDGAEASAIDAALAVVEAEWHAARLERDSFAEALKHIRVYAADPKLREMAGRALAEPAHAALPCAAEPFVRGASRYPFTDELDG